MCVRVQGGATSSLPPTHGDLGLSLGFPCMQSSGKGDGVVMLSTEGAHVHVHPLCQTRRRNSTGPREEEKKICRSRGVCVWGEMRQRIDNNRSANNGQDQVMHKSDPRAAFVLSQLIVPKAHSPQTSGAAEDKWGAKEY